MPKRCRGGRCTTANVDPRGDGGREGDHPGPAPRRLVRKQRVRRAATTMGACVLVVGAVIKAYVGRPGDSGRPYLGCLGGRGRCGRSRVPHDRAGALKASLSGIVVLFLVEGRPTSRHRHTEVRCLVPGRRARCLAARCRERLSYEYPAPGSCSADPEDGDQQKRPCPAIGSCHADSIRGNSGFQREEVYAAR